MPDVFTKTKRSQVMACIRGVGNKGTEVALMRFLRAHRITGWRRHIFISVPSQRCDTRTSATTISGVAARHERGRFFRVRPDFVFPTLRLAVFVDGCFWHRCPLHSTWPKTNAAFWRRKLAANKARDRLVNSTLRNYRWFVLRIWEHELKPSNHPRLARRIQTALTH